MKCDVSLETTMRVEADNRDKAIKKLLKRVEEETADSIGDMINVEIEVVEK